MHPGGVTDLYPRRTFVYVNSKYTHMLTDGYHIWSHRLHVRIFNSNVDNERPVLCALFSSNVSIIFQEYVSVRFADPSAQCLRHPPQLDHRPRP